MTEKNNASFISWIRSPSSDIWLFVVFVVLLNLVASRAFLRLDLTGPKSYSLSNASKEVVKTIEEPLSVKVFFSENLPAPYSSVYQYVKDILCEYKSSSNGNFSYEYYSMDDPEDESNARKYGIAPVQIQEVANNEVGFKSAYMSLAFTYADQIERLENITTTSGLEYKITSTIAKILSNTNALAGLSDSVTVTLYRSSSMSKLGINGFDRMEEIVRKAFDTVNGKFRNRMSFAVVDPEESSVQSLTERYGIQSLRWKDSSETHTGAIGLVVEAGESFRTVPLTVANAIFEYVVSGLDGLEDTLTKSVESLVSKTTKIAYVTNHGELGIQDSQNGAGNFASLVDDNYSFEEIDLSSADIPVGTQSLVINGPKTAFTEEELYKVDQFLLRGGNLMLFLDPFNMQQDPYTGQASYTPIDTGLERLLAAYGVKTGKEYVMDEECYYQNDRQYGRLQFYYAPMLSDQNVNQKHVLSKNLGYLIFLMPGSIDTEEASKNADTAVTVLAHTSPKSWIMKDNIMLSPLMNSAPSDKSTESVHDLAVLVEGSFKSAFDTAVATKQVAEENSAMQDVSTDSHIAKSVQKGKIFLVPTSYITSPQILQADSDEPIALFLKNAVDYMNGNGDLCAMRTKGLSLNTLHVTSGPLANIAKYFNIVGLAVIVVIVGLLVWGSRSKHRKEILLRYDANDVREGAK